MRSLLIYYSGGAPKRHYSPIRSRIDENNFRAPYPDFIPLPTFRRSPINSRIALNRLRRSPLYFLFMISVSGENSDIPFIILDLFHPFFSLHRIYVCIVELPDCKATAGCSYGLFGGRWCGAGIRSSSDEAAGYGRGPRDGHMRASTLRRGAMERGRDYREGPRAPPCSAGDRMYRSRCPWAPAASAASSVPAVSLC